jgi:hypothetical protein
MRKNARWLGDPARLRIGRSVIQPREAGVGNGRGTHRARFEGDVNVMPCQPFLAQRSAGGANGEDFSVGRWVVEFAGAIASGRDHQSCRSNHDRADGHFAAHSGGARLVQGSVHVGAKSHVLLCLGIGVLGKDRFPFGEDIFETKAMRAALAMTGVSD